MHSAWHVGITCPVTLLAAPVPAYAVCLHVVVWRLLRLWLSARHYTSSSGSFTHGTRRAVHVSPWRLLPDTTLLALVALHMAHDAPSTCHPGATH